MKGKLSTINHPMFLV